MGTELVDFAFRGLAVEAVLAGLAWGVALLLPGPAYRRLGLAPGRASGRQLLVLVGATLGLSHGLDALLAATGLRAHSALAEIGNLLHGARGRELGLALLALGLAPAIAEELLCRGLVQRSLVARLPPAASVACGALLFASLHGEPVHAGFALVLGVHLGAVAWWSDSTRAAVLCHAANNGAAVLLGALGAPGGPAGAWTGLAGAVFAGGAWLWISRQGPAGRGAPARPGLQPERGSDDR